jgi:hypothetical protein
MNQALKPAFAFRRRRRTTPHPHLGTKNRRADHRNNGESPSPLFGALFLFGAVALIALVALVTADRYDLMIKTGEYEVRLRPAAPSDRAPALEGTSAP